jgi:hypothetical protein
MLKILFHRYKFVLTGTDQYTRNYMEARPDEFPEIAAAMGGGGSSSGASASSKSADDEVRDLGACFFIYFRSII